MNGLTAEIEALEAFAFEQGEWMDWDAAEWNQQLLLYCVVRDADRHPRDPIRATPEDLPLLVRDPRADPEVMAQTLLQRLRWQARQQEQDVLGQLASARLVEVPAAGGTVAIGVIDLPAFYGMAGKAGSSPTRDLEELIDILGPGSQVLIRQ